MKGGLDKPSVQVQSQTPPFDFDRGKMCRPIRGMGIVGLAADKSPSDSWGLRLNSCFSNWGRHYPFTATH